MTIQELNNLKKTELKQELEKCCGSKSWIKKMMTAFPVSNKASLLKTAKENWKECIEKDWLEAFTHHPKIGDVNSLKKKFASTAKWASGEQYSVQTASKDIILELAEGNAEYEQKFGFIFIVCATGKSASEMLEILKTRIKNKREKELKIAASEQAKITIIRLKKLMS
jgi:2-oxo-4-hydroxy-4-carboxy-5-ureidoimidazoline decarboxylase